jgi:hypothetical protein
MTETSSLREIIKSLGIKQLCNTRQLSGKKIERVYYTCEGETLLILEGKGICRIKAGLDSSNDSIYTMVNGTPFDISIDLNTLYYAGLVPQDTYEILKVKLQQFKDEEGKETRKKVYEHLKLEFEGVNYELWDSFLPLSN